MLAAIWGVLIVVSTIQAERLLGGSAWQILLAGIGVSVAWTFAERALAVVGTVLERSSHHQEVHWPTLRIDSLRAAAVQLLAALPIVAPFAFLPVRAASLVSASVAVVELGVIGFLAGRVARSHRIWLWTLVLPFIVGSVQFVVLLFGA